MRGQQVVELIRRVVVYDEFRIEEIVDYTKSVSVRNLRLNEINFVSMQIILFSFNTLVFPCV